MSNQSDNNKRIAKNTLLLYVRMLFMMVVSLYTSRITLNALGVVDYGIYNVIGGVVATLAFVKTTLSSASQRFITFELGKGNMDSLRKVFANTMSIHLILAVVAVFLGENLGIWFLNTHMNIPSDRMFAANIVLQCALGSFVLTLLNVPYNGLIIAHERMNAFAYISILEVVLKLLIVYAIMIASVDKLILYAILWLCVGMLVEFIYFLYSFKHFSESRVKPLVEKEWFKKMLGFSGYNLCEIFANMMADQGLNILLNLHFGPVVNAARGIAVQVNNAINGFTTNFSTALNPQITKNYASGNIQRMWNLAGYGNRLSFFLLMFLAMPIFFKIDYILEIWLKIPPKECALFIQLMILTNLSLMPSRTFYTAIATTGDIKKYQLTFGLYRLMVFPVCWLALNFIYDQAYVIYIVTLIFEIGGTLFKLYLLKRQFDSFQVIDYLRSVIWPLTYVFIICSVMLYGESKIFEDNILGLVSFVVVSCITSSLIIYFIGFDKKEKELVKSFVVNRLNRKK